MLKVDSGRARDRSRQPTGRRAGTANGAKSELRRTERLVIPLFQETRSLPPGEWLSAKELDGGLSRIVARALDERRFKGEPGESLLLLAPERGRVESVALFGLGPEKKCTLDSLRKAFGALSRRSRREQVGEVTLDLDAPHLRSKLSELGWDRAAKAITMAWTQGGYSFDAYRPAPASVAEKKKPARLVLWAGAEDAEIERAVRAGQASGQIVGDAANYVRDLANTPANDLYPERLAEHARSLARAHGLSFSLLKKRDLERQRMGCLLGVAQGSDRPPCLMTVGYRARSGAKKAGKKVPTLVLVGKAITFDCGGISIKPAKGMEEMKFDMAGGAAVLGAMRAVAELKPAANVIGVIPSAENAIGGSAMRPGDILRSAAGKTVEILNTDAEGRLILADALHYAARFKPDYVMDFATLTGACLVALGTQVSGLVSNDREFSRKVFEAGERSGERVWELPLYDEFLDATKSTVADLKNSAGRNGGAITAAAFLSHFVGKTPWCHLDIAGTAWTERESGPFVAGATGVGVALVEELLRAL